MKSTTSKYGVALLIIIILAVVVIVWQMNVGGGITPSEVVQMPEYTHTTATAPATAPVTTSPKVTQTQKTTTTVSVPVKPTTVMTVTQGTNYVQYMNQLGNNQNTCQTNANAQYKQLYGSLESSSVLSYYNTTNGACYMRVAGKLHVTGSASTTGQIYFRNVGSNTLLAVCTDPTGTMLANNAWICTDNIAKQSMNLTQFSALVGKYTAQ